MPEQKPPTTQDAAVAREILLDGIASDVEIAEILSPNWRPCTHGTTPSPASLAAPGR